MRLYDHLFSKPDPDEVPAGQNYLVNLNPNSLEVLTDARLEPSLGEAKPGERFQFERTGYFCVDAVDSNPGKPVFNRTVTLKDTWAKIEQKRGQVSWNSVARFRELGQNSAPTSGNFRTSGADFVAIPGGPHFSRRNSPNFVAVPARLDRDFSNKFGPWCDKIRVLLSFASLFCSRLAMLNAVLIERCDCAQKGQNYPRRSIPLLASKSRNDSGSIVRFEDCNLYV